MVRYRTAAVDRHQVFYREAGDPEHPTFLLLHGFPSSSHVFRNLIPLLSDRFHLVAPDLPGFGFSWREPNAANRDAIRTFLTPETTKWQYVHGVADEKLVAPESYTLDSALLARPGNDEIQLDLFLDYASNVALYPRFHDYFATRRPPFLAVWGKNDPFFLPAGAEAFPRDNPNAKVHLYDTGHFALETHVDEIAAEIRGFLGEAVGATD